MPAAWRGVFLRGGVVTTAPVRLRAWGARRCRLGTAQSRAEETSGNGTGTYRRALIREHPPLGLVRHGRRLADRAGDRSVRHRSAAARTLPAGGVVVGQFLRGPRGAVRHRRARRVGSALRRGVLRRVDHGVLAVDRQPVRLRDHHVQVCGAAGVSADGAAVGDRARPGHARDLHRPRRRGHRPVLLDLLRLRGVPDLHRDRASTPRRLRGVQREHRPAMGSSGAALDDGVPRSGTAREGGRQARCHADAHCHDRDRHHRPAVRA